MTPKNCNLVDLILPFILSEKVCSEAKEEVDEVDEAEHLV